MVATLGAAHLIFTCKRRRGVRAAVYMRQSGGVRPAKGKLGFPAQWSCWLQEIAVAYRRGHSRPSFSAVGLQSMLKCLGLEI